MKKLIEKAAALTACLIAVIAVTSMLMAIITLMLVAVVNLASGFGGL